MPLIWEEISAARYIILNLSHISFRKLCMWQLSPQDLGGTTI